MMHFIYDTYMHSAETPCQAVITRHYYKDGTLKSNLPNYKNLFVRVAIHFQSNYPLTMFVLEAVHRPRGGVVMVGGHVFPLRLGERCEGSILWRWRRAIS